MCSFPLDIFDFLGHNTVWNLLRAVSSSFQQFPAVSSSFQQFSAVHKLKLKRSLAMYRVCLVFVLALFSGIPESRGSDGPLTAYSGSGELFVLKTGQVVVVMSDIEESQGIVAQSDKGLLLVNDGSTWAIMTTAPQLSVAVIVLDPEADPDAVLHLDGEISVSSVGDDWLIYAQDSTTGTIFETLFAPPFDEAQAASQCTANCPNGSCSCSGFHICWCFCGLFGEPHCIGLIRARGAAALPL